MDLERRAERILDALRPTPEGEPVADEKVDEALLGLGQLQHYATSYSKMGREAAELFVRRVRRLLRHPRTDRSERGLVEALDEDVIYDAVDDAIEAEIQGQDGPLSADRIAEGATARILRHLRDDGTAAGENEDSTASLTKPEPLSPAGDGNPSSRPLDHSTGAQPSSVADRPATGDAHLRHLATQVSAYLLQWDRHGDPVDKAQALMWARKLRDHLRDDGSGDDT